MQGGATPLKALRIQGRMQVGHPSTLSPIVMKFNCVPGPFDRRMIAYYEGETEHPPANLLTALAGALGVTVEALLGTAPVKKTAKGGKPVNSRLARRLQQIEKLDTQEKRQVLQLLDACQRRFKTDTLFHRSAI